MLAKIKGAYTGMVRYILGVRVYSRETRSEPLLRGFPKIEAVQLHRRLRFAGHLWRSREIGKDLLFAKSPASYKPRRGGHFLTYPRQLEKDTGMSGDALRRCMEDREAWDALVTAKVAELKAVYQQPASVKVRTRIPEIGEGRGRRRKPLAELGAARRMT